MAPKKRKAAASSKAAKAQAASSDVEFVEQSPAKRTKANPKVKAKASPRSKAPAEIPESQFDEARLRALFATYADPETKDAILTEGMCSLFEAADLPLDGTLPFVLAWELKASRMGAFTKEEFMHLAETKVDTVKKLQKYVQDACKTVESDPSLFRDFYKFLFRFCLEEGQKSMPMDTAKTIWTVCLAKRNAVARDLIAFLDTQTYKGVTKDVWMSLSDFIEEVELDDDQRLINYSEEDSSWPSLMDEYAAWVNRGRVAPPVET